MALIENFLDTIPKDEEKDAEQPKRKPTPADAAVDYVAYLLESAGDMEPVQEVPQLKGQQLIDSFIEQDSGRFVLSDTPEYSPEEMLSDMMEKDNEEEYFTETLARIYVKQGRYSKALEIIKRLSLAYPKKNAYFADQIRFLEKLIINSNNKN